MRVPNAVKSDVRSLAVRLIVGQPTATSGAGSRESEVSVYEISATITVHRGEAAGHWTPAAAYWIHTQVGTTPVSASSAVVESAYV